jgi:hypothetical protein
MIGQVRDAADHAVQLHLLRAEDVPAIVEELRSAD